MRTPTTRKTGEQPASSRAGSLFILPGKPTGALSFFLGLGWKFFINFQFCSIFVVHSRSFETPGAKSDFELSRGMLIPSSPSDSSKPCSGGHQGERKYS